MRSRQITDYPSHKGKACESNLKEIRACNVDACGSGLEDFEIQKATSEKVPVDCELDYWSDWAECTESCGGGLQTRTRTISQRQRDGGKSCDGAALKEMRGCAEEKCPPKTEEPHETIDCEWAKWDNWGACSVSCGGGEQVRQRQIAQMPNKWGAACPLKASMEVQKCNMQACESVDCVWTEWTSWGACSCNGLQERHRNIDTQAAGAGKGCAGAKVETQSCEPNCLKEPVNCELTDWSYWTDCTKTCDGGEQERKRKIAQSMKHRGAVCKDAVLKEIRGCGAEACNAPTDCVVGAWSSYSECSTTCGGGQMKRTRKATAPTWGGKECPADLVLEEISPCNEGSCGESVDCQWGEWSSFSACSSSCGGGQQFRDRNVAVAPRKNGQLCDAKAKTEIVACNEFACDESCVNAEWGSWNYWSECSASCGAGYMKRTREIATAANDCGAPAEGDYEEFMPCNEQECTSNAVDCEFSAWGDWSDCSASCNGIQDHTRRIAKYAHHGGKGCDGKLKEVLPCNVIEGCGVADPVDCELSSWSYWSSCSSPCGTGAKTRKREVVTEPKNGGVPCKASLHEVEKCNEQSCLHPVDCAWGKWQDWGACSKDCGTGEQTRFRHIETVAKEGGAACDAHSGSEVRTCNEMTCGTPTFCLWGQWGGWGSCSKSCGKGSQSRKRYLVTI